MGSEMCIRDSGSTGRFCLPMVSQERPFGALNGDALRCDAFLSLNKNWDGVICLPNPNGLTNWVLTSAEEIISFQPFSTVSMVNALWDGPQPEVVANTLITAMQDIQSRPERLAARLAELQQTRSANARPEAELFSELWGILLGAEFAAARAYWLGQNIALIAPNEIASPYMIAFEAQAIPVTRVDHRQMTLLGFMRAKARIS